MRYQNVLTLFRLLNIRTKKGYYTSATVDNNAPKLIEVANVKMLRPGIYSSPNEPNKHWFKIMNGNKTVCTFEVSVDPETLNSDIPELQWFENEHKLVYGTKTIWYHKSDKKRKKSTYEIDLEVALNIN